MHVVAIDAGALDHMAIASFGINYKVVEPGEKASLQRLLGQFAIVHFKMHADTARKMMDIKVHMIVNDTNLSAKDSAEAMLPYLDILADDGLVVMTVKCVDRNVEKHIGQAKDALRGALDIVSVRSLPSNRQEVTIFARKKAHE